MPPYEQSLGDGLTLRSVRDERDAQRYVAFFRQTIPIGPLAPQRNCYTTTRRPAWMTFSL